MNSNNNNSQKPAIILVEPQMGENIGAVARAMANFALDELIIIAPRDGWPNPAAYAMASGADYILDNAGIYDNFSDGVGKFHLLFATTARSRDMATKSLSPYEASELIIAENQQHNAKSAIIFGAERTGLTNDVISLSHYIIEIATNPNFKSLNLAQAVLLVASCYFNELDNNTNQSKEVEHQNDKAHHHNNELATQEDIHQFIAHLNIVLEKINYYRNQDMKKTMQHNLNSLIVRAGFSVQEIRSLRGMLRRIEYKIDK